MDDVASVSTGVSHTMVIRKDNSLWGFGENNFGELGDGTTVSKSIPVKIMDDATSVSAGNLYTMIIKKDNSLWGTGNNNAGSICTNIKTDYGYFKTPIKVMDDIVFAVASLDYTMIVKKDGTLWLNGSKKFMSPKRSNKSVQILF